MRLLHRLGIPERTSEPDVGAGEVERLGLGPQPSDHRERLGEALHGVREIVERQPVRFVLPPGQGLAGSGAGADAEVEPPSGNDVHRRGDLGQHRGRPEAVAGHQQPDP